MLAASGCASGPIDPCGIFKPIRPAAADLDVISDRLVEQLLEHNEAGAAACDWMP